MKDEGWIETEDTSALMDRPPKWTLGGGRGVGLLTSRKNGPSQTHTFTGTPPRFPFRRFMSLAPFPPNTPIPQHFDDCRKRLSAASGGRRIVTPSPFPPFSNFPPLTHTHTLLTYTDRRHVTLCSRDRPTGHGKDETSDCAFFFPPSHTHTHTDTQTRQCPAPRARRVQRCSNVHTNKAVLCCSNMFMAYV